MDTLRLDHTWTPLDIISWQRAMVLICDNKVDVLEEYEDRTIRSARMVYQMPAVVCHIRPIRKKKPKVRFNRHAIYDRDGGRCCYCGKQVEFEKYTFDHMVPRSYGGLTTWTNIVTCCFPCNQKKRNRTPEEAGMRLIQAPFKPVAWRATKTVFSWCEGMPQEWRHYLPALDLKAR